MPLLYSVKPKTILLCDYGAGGFRPPEMVKRRPAVVITGDLAGRGKLHTVVPLSGTPSDVRNRYHCRIELGEPLPDPFFRSDLVGEGRHDRHRRVRSAGSLQNARDQYGKRRYLSNLRVTDEQFAAIHIAIRHALLIPLNK